MESELDARQAVQLQPIRILGLSLHFHLEKHHHPGLTKDQGFLKRQTEKAFCISSPQSIQDKLQPLGEVLPFPYKPRQVFPGDDINGSTFHDSLFTFNWFYQDMELMPGYLPARRDSLTSFHTCQLYCSFLQSKLNKTQYLASSSTFRLRIGDDPASVFLRGVLLIKTLGSCFGPLAGRLTFFHPGLSHSSIFPLVCWRLGWPSVLSSPCVVNLIQISAIHITIYQWLFISVA